MQSIFFLSQYFSLLLASLSFVQAVPTPLSVTPQFIPAGWTQIGRAAATTTLPLRFGLAQSNLDSLYTMLLDVSDPTSANYGKHWTPAQVTQAFAPNASTILSVATWLQTSGIDSSRLSLSLSRQWLSFNSSVGEAETLLGAQFFVFNDASGAVQIASPSYSLPLHVSPLIAIIKPTAQTTGLIVPKTPFPTDAIANLGPGTAADGIANCDVLITPACLQALYQVNYVPTQTQNNSFGIVEYGVENFLQTDLSAFAQIQSPTQAQTTPGTILLIDGGVVNPNDPNLDHAESNLDLDYAMALTSPQPITLLQGANFDDWTDAFNQAQLCSSSTADVRLADLIALESGQVTNSCFIKLPNVVSISYGDDEINFSAAQATQLCNELGKVGLMGTTVLYSAGDHGLASNVGTCSTNGVLVNQGTTAVPVFPASCPYITSVGATQITPGLTVQAPEEVWNQGGISSGGGFSNIFPMPSYQAAAVGAFLGSNPVIPNVNVNLNGARAYPDLSANGANYSIILDGSITPVSGTSASAPVVGALVTLINDARIAAGKSPVGFINPTIYSSNFSTAFNDITRGGAQGCDNQTLFGGFNATTGWDPVSGLGTPNFPTLMAKFLALP